MPMSTHRCGIAALTVAVALGGPLFAQQEGADPAPADEAESTRQEVPGPGSTFQGRPGASAEADQSAEAADGRRSSEADPSFEGYDFGQVVQRMERSVDPLQREMDRSFETFTSEIDKAEQLLDEGEPRRAVQTAAAAMDSVLSVRDKVLDPMWEGQQYLTTQVANVRSRLARAVAAEGGETDVELDQRTERMLDGLAQRIDRTDDALRRKQLTAHYRTVRSLAKIKRLAAQMSPDQRQLWINVLKVLERATLAHQRVLMGSEVLFAQLETTSANLQEYLELMETVDGAARLMGMVNGADEQAADMAGFTESMSRLQGRLEGFSDTLQQSLTTSMHQLEAQVEAVQPVSDQGTGPVSVERDSELEARLKRLHDEDSGTE